MLIITTIRKMIEKKREEAEKAGLNALANLILCCIEYCWRSLETLIDFLT
jgi:hypothetical protein